MNIKDLKSRGIYVLYLFVTLGGCIEVKKPSFKSLSKRDINITWLAYSYTFEKMNRNNLSQDKPYSEYNTDILTCYPYINEIFLDAIDSSTNYIFSSFVCSGNNSEIACPIEAITISKDSICYFNGHSRLIDDNNMRNRHNIYCDSILTTYLVNSKQKIHPFIYQYLKESKNIILNNEVICYKISKSIQKSYPNLKDYSNYWK